MSKTAIRDAADKTASALSITAAFSAMNPGHRVEFAMVDYDTLDIDPSIQRDEEPDEIGRIVREFNPSALGIVTVSVRDVSDPVTGEPVTHSFLVDGQQRRAVCRIVGYEHKLPALVHYGLTKAQEAQLFLDLNNRKGVGPWSKYKSRIQAGEPQALAIQAILTELDVPIGPPSGFSAIAKADSIYRSSVRGGANLRFALEMMRDTYGSYDGRILGGFARLYEEFASDSRFKVETLRERLADFAPTTLNIVRSANTIYATYGGKADLCYAEALAGFYNRRFRRNSGNGLPSLFHGQKQRGKVEELHSGEHEVDADQVDDAA
jgi:hypothetical protein